MDHGPLARPLAGDWPRAGRVKRPGAGHADGWGAADAPRPGRRAEMNPVAAGGQDGRPWSAVRHGLGRAAASVRADTSPVGGPLETRCAQGGSTTSCAVACSSTAPWQSPCRSAAAASTCSPRGSTCRRTQRQHPARAARGNGVLTRHERRRGAAGRGGRAHRAGRADRQSASGRGRRLADRLEAGLTVDELLRQANGDTPIDDGAG